MLFGTARDVAVHRPPVLLFIGYCCLGLWRRSPGHELLLARYWSSCCCAAQTSAHVPRNVACSSSCVSCASVCMCLLYCQNHRLSTATSLVSLAFSEVTTAASHSPVARLRCLFKQCSPRGRIMGTSLGNAAAACQ
jgi:hypothetical protein